MSQVKLTLRPPPNVDFVHGYPGIPPGPDRPQAAVKGAIEVRVPAQGVKAKWVRIELRKVETLPGGGQANTFYDFVGPSPVNLWTSPDEYGMLRTQDFPFSIRIPESIPPSIALEKLAGINYELVASVCTKGKKGFLRKAKSVVVSTQAPIIIDKHELHTTWPVYCQPEQRHLIQDGLTLMVERTNTCYGPGDRISLWATLKSDSLHPVVLRGFEMQLKESTVYRSGPFAGAGKKGVPQVKVGIVSEAKFAVNATIYGGTMHNAELTCGVSPDHTTTTLNAARHIDVTYKLVVKALMGAGQPLIMELPVIISNWQRHVSQEAIRRIGPAPSLSLSPAPPSSPTPQQQITRVEPIAARPTAAATLPVGRTTQPATAPADEFGYASNPRNPSAFNTAPVQQQQQHSIVSKPSILSTTSSTTRVPDEGLGYGVGVGASAGYTKTPTAASTYGHQSTPSRTSISPTEEFGTLPPAVLRAGGSGGGSMTASSTAVGRRPNSGRATGAAANRFTITNAHPSEISEDGASVKGGKVWPTAEEEKARLYESARAKVERTQASVTPPPPVRQASPPPVQKVPPSPPVATGAPVPRGTPRTGPWPTAEDEKLRLFAQAQAAVNKTHNQAPGYSPPASLHGRNNSIEARGGGSSSVASKPSAAEMYSQAMASRKPDPQQQQLPVIPKATPAVPYLTAEQEKAALRRYHDAVNAVNRTQKMDEPSGASSGMAGPVAYEALYPSTAGGSSSHQNNNDLPPPFESTSGIPAVHLSEKERMRRAYEAQDAAAALARNASVASTVHTQTPAQAAYPSPPPFSSNNASPFSSAIAEKEALRRKLEAQDAAAAIKPLAPVRNASVTSNTRGNLPRPTPATPPATTKILTAAEEKALLRARYEAEDRPTSQPRVNGNGFNGSSAGPLTPPLTAPISPPPPPPLMPRPPVEYIQETQEEDARVSQYAINGQIPHDDLSASSSSGQLANGNRTLAPGIDMQPFTPFTPGFDAIKTPGPPPPLPPKPAGE